MMRPTYVRESVGSRMSGSWFSAMTSVFLGPCAGAGSVPSIATATARVSTTAVFRQFMATSIWDLPPTPQPPPPPTGGEGEPDASAPRWPLVLGLPLAGCLVLDAPEEALPLRAILPPHPVPVGHRHLVHAPQLGHRIGVIVDAEVVVAARLLRGDQEGGGLLAALVAAGGLAGL